MSWFSNKSEFPWVQLNEENSVQEIIEKSYQKPVIIFKHSTRCSISSLALARFEREWLPDEQVHLFYLDLIAYRNLSNEIAKILLVEHQSPQVILLINGNIISTSSHNSISAKELKSFI